MLFKQENLRSFLLVQEKLKINWWHPWLAFSPFLQIPLVKKMDHYLPDGNFEAGRAADVLSFLITAWRTINHWYRIKT